MPSGSWSRCSPRSSCWRSITLPSRSLDGREPPEVERPHGVAEAWRWFPDGRLAASPGSGKTPRAIANRMSSTWLLSCSFRMTFARCDSAVRRLIDKRLAMLALRPRNRDTPGETTESFHARPFVGLPRMGSDPATENAACTVPLLGGVAGGLVSNTARGAPERYETKVQYHRRVPPPRVSPEVLRLTSTQGIAPVAIVDDDPSVRRALRRLIHSVGYGVQTFASAGEVLDA